jgi:hypothetical protein
LTVPRWKSVSHAVTAEIDKATTEIVIESGSAIRSNAVTLTEPSRTAPHPALGHQHIIVAHDDILVASFAFPCMRCLHRNGNRDYLTEREMGWTDMRTLIVIALLCGPLVFAQNAEPTEREIADAYRSKIGEGSTLIPHLRWESWRVREVRGWSLHFKRVSEKRTIGVLTRQYGAVARKNGLCAQYQITDTISLPPVNVQIEPSLAIEPSGVKSCR